MNRFLYWLVCQLAWAAAAFIIGFYLGEQAEWMRQAFAALERTTRAFAETTSYASGREQQEGEQKHGNRR